jgi:peptidoglycan hydrolase-like protein with peptidoglycan-binding domain
VGFHAAYRTERNEPEISAPANALVGAYLSRLGLPDRAISYITSAPPQGMTWLSFNDAEKVGIEVKPFELALNDPPSQPQNRRERDPQEAPNPTGAEKPTSEKADPPGTQTAAIKEPPTTQEPIFRPPGPPELEPQVLDLASLDAASQVQRRLQERGYFNGLVDGVWGPKSRIALRDFKAANQLGTDDGWDLRVQLALFDDRYRVASADYVPPDPVTTTDGLFRPFSPLPGTKLHPLNRPDTLRIQARLSELGYYRKAGDGIWGLASRYALRDFKAANGLSSDDVWDSSVEALIEKGRAIHAAATPFGEWARVGTSCSDPSNPQRLSISAKEISARQVTCRLEHTLARSGDTWFGTASCLRNQQAVALRLSLAIVQGRLVDHSAPVSAPRSETPPSVFERCR